jgi:hypothetical protein
VVKLLCLLDPIAPTQVAEMHHLTSMGLLTPLQVIEFKEKRFGIAIALQKADRF